jgi:hypothetical protein
MRGTLKREVLALVLSVVVLDALFVGIYFLAGLGRASDGMKVVFTAVWTLATLLVVIRGFSRIRAVRASRTSG